MLKKVMLGLLLLISVYSLSAFAKPDDLKMCNFADNMFFMAPPGAQIIAAKVTGGLSVEKLSPLSFRIRDNGACTWGTVSLIVGYNEFNYTEIQFSDGPWDFRPKVMGYKNVGDFRYVKMSHTLFSDDYYVYFR